MRSLRYRVEPRDAPAAVAAKVLGLSEQEFAVKRPELEQRGFPAPDPTTGLFDLDAIEAWRKARHPHLFLTAAPQARDARLVVPARLGGFKGG